MKYGKKYIESSKLVDKNKMYDSAEALSLVCQTAKAKFDETVELHVRLGVDSRHADQQVRGSIVPVSYTHLDVYKRQGLVLTVCLTFLTTPVLRLFGADGVLLSLGKSYLSVISLGACLQIIGTGLVPLIRNNGGSFYAMFAMVAGFVTNIFLDYLFVWVFEWRCV